MIHVDQIQDKPEDAEYVFANPKGGWDCYASLEELPSDKRAMVLDPGTPDVGPKGQQP